MTSGSSELRVPAPLNLNLSEFTTQREQLGSQRTASHHCHWDQAHHRSSSLSQGLAPSHSFLDSSFIFPKIQAWSSHSIFCKIFAGFPVPPE